MWEPVTSDLYFWLGAAVFGVIGWIARGLWGPPTLGRSRGESMVLVALDKLGGDAYTVPIRQQLSQLAGKEISLGFVYACCDTLVTKRLLETYQGDAWDTTEERGGRRKRYYRLTEQGQRLVRLIKEAEELHSDLSASRNGNR